MRGLGPKSGIKKGEAVNSAFRMTEIGVTTFGNHNPHGPDYTSNTNIVYWLNNAKIYNIHT